MKHVLGMVGAAAVVVLAILIAGRQRDFHHPEGAEPSGPMGNGGEQGVEVTIPGTPEAPAERSPAAPGPPEDRDLAAPERTEGRLVLVTVREAGSRAVIPRAEVEMVAKGAYRKRVLTNAQGVARFPLDAEPVYVLARAPGRAPFLHRYGPDEQEGAKLETETVLRPGAELRVRVIDTYNTLRASHKVRLYYVGQDAGGTVFPPGTLEDRAAWTNEEGVAIVADLEEGLWEVGAADWRECDSSPRSTVPTRVGVPSTTELVVEKADPNRYAHARIELPENAAIQEGIVTNYFLGRRGRYVPVYEGGDVYVFGEPGEVVSAHIAESGTGTRKSEPFPLTIGESGLVITPVWGQ